MFDVIGMLVPVVLAVLFGWLTLRSWGSQHRILKWPALVLSGLVTLLAVLVFALGLAGFVKLNEQFNNPVANVKVAGTPAQIARGAQFANICAQCHGTTHKPPLAGADLLARFGAPPLGTVWAPNLTPSGNIQGWSDGELIRAIREGVHKNGRSLIIMPSEEFRAMSDEDVQAVVAYIRSEPPTGNPTPENGFNLLGALFMNMQDFRTRQAPAGSIKTPALGTAEYGKYMVDIIGCRSCHGQNLTGKMPGGLGPPAGPNLTLIVPQWTREQFMAFFNTGIDPKGYSIPTDTLSDGFVEPRMPWKIVRAVANDDELASIYEYVHNLPKAESFK